MPCKGLVKRLMHGIHGWNSKGWLEFCGKSPKTRKYPRFSSPPFPRIPTQNPLKMPNAKTWQILCWLFFTAPVCPCPSHSRLHPAIFPYMKTTIALVDNLYPLSLLMFFSNCGKKHCQRFIVYKSVVVEIYKASIQWHHMENQSNFVYPFPSHVAMLFLSSLNLLQEKQSSICGCHVV